MKRTISALMLLLMAVLSSAAQQPPTDRARVLDAYGQVQRQVSRNPDNWTVLREGDLLAPDSAVRTGERSAILLQMPDRHAIRVGGSTTLEVKEVGKGGSFSFQLVAGEIWSFVNKARKPARYEIDTPTAVLGVRGTIFHVGHDVAADESEVSVNDGSVTLNQGGVTQSLEKGFEMRFRRNQLAQVKANRHRAGTQQMWRLILRENWTGENPKARLNRDADGELLKNRLRERAEIARRTQQEAAREKAQQAKAKAKAGKTPPAKKR